MKIFILILLVISQNTFACIWDKDTYAMEKQKFPTTFELITGNFDRHSKDYYKWRILKLQPIIDANSKDENIYDDLATAYSKLNQDKKAIEIMLLKDKFSQKKYETYANLGTFYIHDGQFEKGLIYINKAIKINPNAHFGREIYQKYLVEYILEQRKNKNYSLNFHDFLLKNYKITKKNNEIRNLPEIEIKKAVKGVLGMMRFGNYDSPILLKALGDLLLNDEYETEISTKRLAVMAYTNAEMKSSKELSISFINQMNMILSLHETEMNTFDSVLNELKNGLKNGAIYWNQIKLDELNWIKNNEDVDLKFNEKYYNKFNEVNIEQEKISKHQQSNQIITKNNQEQINKTQKFDLFTFKNILYFVLAFAFGFLGLYLYKKNKL